MLLQKGPTDKIQQGGQEAESCQKSHAAIQPTHQPPGWFLQMPPALPLVPLAWGWGDTMLLDRAPWAESCQGRRVPMTGHPEAI